MKLTELIEAADPAPQTGWPPRDPEIAGLTADSRAVRPGFLFAALQRHPARRAALCRRGGSARRGGDPDRRRRSPRPGAEDAAHASRSSPTPTRSAGWRCWRRAFTGGSREPSPPSPAPTARPRSPHFTREIWTAAGHPAASLGTLGLVTPDGRRAGRADDARPGGSAPRSRRPCAQGIEHVAIEASSHGLAQFRLDGLSVAAAAFTNLTRDHLDYHRDMAHYRAAKERLFTAICWRRAARRSSTATASEFPRLAALCRERGHPVLAYGADAAADLRLWRARAAVRGQDLATRYFRTAARDLFCRCSASSRR